MIFYYSILNELRLWGFPGGIVLKNPPASAGDMGSIPVGGVSPRVGNGNPTQYSFLENFMDRVKLAGYSPWSLKDLDMTEQLSSCIGCTELSKFSHLMWSATIVSLETWQGYS